MPDGQSIVLPDFSLEADESKLIHLDRLLLRENIVGTLGYLKVSYAGKLMATGAQLTLYPLAGMGGLDSARSLTVDFKDAHRTAVAWFPPHSTATVALSNVSASPITVTSRITGRDQDHFTLEPHSTRITTLNSDTLDQVALSSPFFHDLSFAGPLDSLRVAGYVAPNNGSPLPLRYYDPAVSTSTNLTAVGVDTAAPTYVAIYNVTNAPYTMTPELRTATDEPSDPVTVPPMSVPAHGATYIDIGSALRTLASRSAPLATLTLATTAPAGSLVGALSQEKVAVDAVEDVPFRTSNPPIYMRGFYPLRWTSDYKNMAFVTNASPFPKKVSAYVIADGITYNLAPVQLQPFATHVYDVDAMRADQVADFKGVRIPLSSKSGKFQWAGDPKDNNVGLIGRMEVLSRKDKRASSFSCGGSCPANSTAPIFSGPTFGNFPIGGTTVLTAVEQTYDSYGNPISEPLTGSQTGLSSSVPQVLSLNGNPSSTQIPLAAMSRGSSNMSYTQVTNTYYPANGYSCQDNPTNSPGGGTAVVQVPTASRIVSNQTNGSATDCPLNSAGQIQAGWNRVVNKVVTDQQSPAQDITVAGQMLTETVKVGSPDDFHITSVGTASGKTGVGGSFTDQLRLCSASCPSSAGQSFANQSISDVFNGTTFTLSPNTFRYTCKGNTINGQ